MKNIELKFGKLRNTRFTEIIKYLEKNNADIAPMGAYGLSGMGLVLFGSNAKRVAHRAPCSVMIVR